jgi:predicted nuclease with TOPRIM domain
MSIHIKKYTKDQMAKMVEDAAERLKSQKKENAELAEQLKSQTAKTIALRNDLMAKMHSNAVLTEKLDQMNGEAITRENVIANLKADADVLRNKIADTEAALGRANACIATMQVEKDQQTKEIFEWQGSAQALHDDILDARERANYAEAHPWKNLWAWFKREAARHE